MFSEHSMGSGESKKDRARVRSQSSSVTNQLNDFMPNNQATHRLLSRNLNRRFTSGKMRGYNPCTK